MGGGYVCDKGGEREYFHPLENLATGIATTVGLLAVEWAGSNEQNYL